MRPEYEYLAALLRRAVHPGPTRIPVAEGIDWTLVHDLLLRQGLICAVAQVIAHSDVPLSLREAVAATNRRLRRRTAYLFIELKRLIRVLASNDCEPLVLKGAALARTLYPTPFSRYFKDLDILVPRDRVDRATQALGDLGYRLTWGARSATFYERHHFHFSFIAHEGLNVEIHWDLSRPSDYYRFDVDGIFARSRALDFDGAVARIPDEPDQLLHAASQALGEGFTDLRRVMDTAWILRGGVGDPDALVERAHAQGLSTALWLLLRQTRRLTGVAGDVGLEPQLAPRAPCSVCLRSLEPEAIGPASLADDRPQFVRPLVRWLCAPKLRTTFAEMLRFVAPIDEDYLDWGYDPATLPSRARRALIAFRRTASAARILGYQARHLAANGLRPSSDPGAH